MNATSALTRLSQFAVLALVLTGSHAFGQSTITQTVSFSGLGGTSSTDALSFNSFDSSLGTLTSVQIILENVSLSGSASATNNSNVGLPGGDTNGPEDIYVNLTGRLQVTASGGVNINLNAEDTANNFQTEVAVGGSTSTYIYSNSASSPSSSSQTTSTTGGYIGDGVTQITVNVKPTLFGVTGIAVQSADSTANYVSASYNGSATGAGDVEIIYTYTPVPEPSKTATAMIGLALCLLIGRHYFKGQGSLRLS